MKRLRAWSYGVVLTAGILLTAGMNGTEADAAAIGGGAITIDYANQKLTVTSATDAEIFFATVTAKKVKGKDYKRVTPSAWDTYDYDTGKGVTIDLSFLNRAKENYIQIKGDINADPVTIQIPAVLSKVSANYDTKKATVTMLNVQDKKNPVTLSDAMEYRTVYSGWQDYSAVDDDLSMYQKRGAKLYFRLKVKAAEPLNDSFKVENSDLVDTENKPVEVYKVSSFPGVEKLVTVKKEAAAPKVTVDYAKHQFSVPKAAEYRVVTALEVTQWKELDEEKVKLNLSDISLPSNTIKAALEVRVAATDTKVASKIQRVEFSLPEKTSVYSAQGETKGAYTGIELLANNFFYNAVGTSETDMPVVAGCAYKKTTKEVTGILFDNESQDAYEICVVKAQDVLNGPPTPDLKGLYTLKAKAANAKKNAVLTINIKNLTDGDKLYIRKKANTKTMTWSSSFAGFGTVNFAAMEEFVKKGN